MLAKVFEKYVANIKVALLFALLLAFVPVFVLPFLNAGIFVSSGTIFIELRIFKYLPVLILLAIIYLAIFSFFISLIVFSIRRDLSSVKVEFYLDEMISKFSSRLFAFYSLMLVVFYLALLFATTLTPLTALLIYFLVFLISFLLMFVPQALVVDERNLRGAIVESIHFVKRYPKESLTALFVGSALLLLLALFEFLLDRLVLEFLFAEFITLIFALVFVVPFMEVLKTYLYMLKYHLIKKSELLG